MLCFSPALLLLLLLAGSPAAALLSATQVANLTAVAQLRLAEARAVLGDLTTALTASNLTALASSAAVQSAAAGLAGELAQMGAALPAHGGAAVAPERNLCFQPGRLVARGPGRGHRA